jgi:hypothetical protein
MRSLFSVFVSLSWWFFSQHVFAQITPHGATLEERRSAVEINRSLERTHRLMRTSAGYVPVPDDHPFAYVLMAAADDNIGEIRELRRLIATNLPADVKLVLLTTEAAAPTVRRRYEGWIAADRLILATDDSENNRNGFWARDAFPMPVLDAETKTASLVAHQYFRPFDSFKTIASAVQGQMMERPEVFVGGNLLADRQGHCFSVDSERLFDLGAAEIQEMFGCVSVHILDYLAGIGDVDEVIKPLGENIMLTNQTRYVDQLKELGYQVVMLPAIEDSFRTYLNSLVVGSTVFMPSYGGSEDVIAQKVYEGLGFRVVPIRSVFLSDRLNGSVHCQTMAYPAIKKQQLLDGLGLRELH